MVAHFRSLLLLLFLFCCIQCRSNQVSTEIVVSEQAMQAVHRQSGVYVVVTSCQYHGYSYDLSRGDLFYMLSVKGKIIIPQSHAHPGTFSAERGKVVIVAVPGTEDLYLDAVDEYVEGTEYVPEKIYWKKDTMIYCTDFNGNEDQNIDCILSKDDHTKLSKGEYIICLIYRKAKDQSYYSLYDRNYAVGTIVVRDSRMDFSRLESALRGDKIKIEDQDIAGQNKSLNFSLKIRDSTVISDHSEMSFIVNTNQGSEDRDRIIKEFLKNRTFGRDNLLRTGVYIVPAQFEQGEITAHWYPDVHLSGGIDVYLYMANQDGYVYYPLVFGHNITYTVEKTISLNESSNVEITLCELLDSSSTDPLLKWMRVDTRVYIDNAPIQNGVYILLAKDTSPNIQGVQQYLEHNGQGTSSMDMDWYILKQEDTSHHIVLDSRSGMQSATKFSQYKVFIVKEEQKRRKIVWESGYETLSKGEDKRYLLNSVMYSEKYESSTIISGDGSIDQRVQNVEKLYADHIQVMKEMFACFRDQIGFVVYTNKAKGRNKQGGTYQHQVMSGVEAFLKSNDTGNEFDEDGNFVLLIRDREKDEIPSVLFNWINNVHATRQMDDVYAFLMVWRLGQDGKFIPLGVKPGCRMLRFVN